jgi:hypothetical protein
MRQGRAPKPGEDPLASLAKGARERRPQAARAFLVAVAPLVLRTARSSAGTTRM